VDPRKDEGDSSSLDTAEDGGTDDSAPAGNEASSGAAAAGAGGKKDAKGAATKRPRSRLGRARQQAQASRFHRVNL
jgi:hypothetical protein